MRPDEKDFWDALIMAMLNDDSWGSAEEMADWADELLKRRRKAEDTRR